MRQTERITSVSVGVVAVCNCGEIVRPPERIIIDGVLEAHLDSYQTSSTRLFECTALYTLIPLAYGVAILPTAITEAVRVRIIASIEHHWWIEQARILPPIHVNCRTHDAHRFRVDRDVVRIPEAETRAHALLLRLLSKEQRGTYETSRHFDAKGNETGHLYRIRYERQINITNLTLKCRLCYVCPDMPISDQLVAQKLLIEGDEASFLKIAKVWRA